MIHGVGHPGHGELPLIEELGTVGICARILLRRSVKLKLDPYPLTFPQRERAESRIPEAGLLGTKRVFPLSSDA
jgi:hypothetical protein